MTATNLISFSENFDAWFTIALPTPVELQVLKPKEVPEFEYSKDRLMYIDCYLRDILQKSKVTAFESKASDAMIRRVSLTLQNLKRQVDICKETMRVIREYSAESTEDVPRAIARYNKAAKEVKHLIMRADKRNPGNNALVYGLYWAMSGQPPPDRSAKNLAKKRVNRWLLQQRV